MEAHMRTCLILLALLPAGFAPAPFPRPDRGRADSPRLDGVYFVKSIEYQGSPWKGAMMGGLLVHQSAEVTIDRGEVRIHIQGRDPSDRRPSRSVILVHRGGKFDLPQAPPLLGIYHLEGGTLTLCFPDDARKGRPTSFDRKFIVMVLGRR
jgi:uncharacterized protein (TIGR03067 family)